MKFLYNDTSVRLTGRWDTSDPRFAEATATGSYIELCFEGDMACLMFDISANLAPMPHIWIQIDGGASVSAPIDAYIPINAGVYGKHTVRVIYKSSVEAYNRWYSPRHGKISFIGYCADKALPIEPDTRPIIEFVGDSITEGVLTDADYFGGQKPYYEIDQMNRIHQDDVCATYAWLIAERLNMRPIFMGYGAVGVTRVGAGKVPAAPFSYPYNFDGSPISRGDGCADPSVIMINHGANDRGATAEKYVSDYGMLIDKIRRLNPNATVVALSAFCGAHHVELGEFIEKYNTEHGCKVHYIDTFGWIPVTPLHPLRDGHRIVADNTVPKLEKILKGEI